MSQEAPVPIETNMRKVYKTSQESVNRSGILERYTYKTDSGQLLNTAINCSKKHKIRTYVNRRANGANTRADDTISADTKAEDAIGGDNKANGVLVSGNANNQVRTEHCDSTTDIIEENFAKDALKMFDLHENISLLTRTVLCNASNTIITCRQTIDIDSDSDCQIVDAAIDDKKEENGMNSPNTLSWVNKTEETITGVHVISDSDDDENLENISNCKLPKKEPTHLCERTGVLCVDIKPLKSEISASLDDQKPICDVKPDVKVTLPVIDNTIGPGFSNSLSTHSEKESLILLNQKYHSVKNLIQGKNTGNSLNRTNIHINPPSCSISLERMPQKHNGMSPVKGDDCLMQRVQNLAPLSPESSKKSEFYSYLKINTNPLASKAEIVAKNRRSVRVRNIIKQIEKTKELHNEKTIKILKSEDIRKKYLTYSKPDVIFPPVPVHHNTISDFQGAIESWFETEGINYKETVHTNNIPVRNEPEDKPNEYSPKRKIDENNLKFKHRKNIAKCLRKKNEIKSRKTHMSALSDTKLRSLRFKSNRMLRGAVRITRNSSDMRRWFTPKPVKARKAKLKIKLIKNKQLAQKNVDFATVDKETTTIENVDNTLVIENIKAAGGSAEDSSHSVHSPNILSLPDILAKKLTDALNSNMSAKDIACRNKWLKRAELEKANKLKNGAQGISSDKTTKSEPINNSLIARAKESTSETNAAKKPESFSLNHINEISLDINALRTNSFNLNDIKEITLTEAPTSDQELELLNKSVVDIKSTELTTERSSSPFCFGFLLDDNSIRIRENMQNAVTSINCSPVIMNDLKDNVSVVQIQENSAPVDDESNSDAQFSEVSSIHEETVDPDVIDTALINNANRKYIPLNPNIRTMSFHRSLIQAATKRKSNIESQKLNMFEYSDSDSSISSPNSHTSGKRSTTHEIDINKNNGAVFNAYFINGILVIVQELLISFWKQTALGNILGVQNMWLPHGNLQRIILDPGCVNRRSSEMILTADNVVAYIELWTKEHKCHFRECPISDVFATIYFHRGHGAPDKKVLQLENIKGYGDDVRFAVIRTSREIIVSWCDTFSKPIKTLVRCYQLTADFQSIASIKEMKFASHYISSLHNIHDCENMVLGAGNEQISVWNLQDGYLITTVNLSENSIQPPLESKTICLYAQCDTGFLFLVQQTDIGVLRLVAVNGMTHEWKQLHSYQVPDSYKKLLGVIVESGVLMTCYTNGFLCWNMHSGEILAEIDTTNEHIVLPSNKYLVAIDNYQVTVQHIMSYILTHDW